MADHALATFVLTSAIPALTPHSEAEPPRRIQMDLYMQFLIVYGIRKRLELQIHTRPGL